MAFDNDFPIHRQVFFFLKQDDSIDSVAFSRDGKTFISGSADNTIKLWHIST